MEEMLVTEHYMSFVWPRYFPVTTAAVHAWPVGVQREELLICYSARGENVEYSLDIVWPWAEEVAP